MLMTLAKAVAWFAERGIPTTRTTLASWIRDGVLLAGRRIYLAAQRVGRRWFVRAEALAEFLDALNQRPATPCAC